MKNAVFEIQFLVKLIFELICLFQPAKVISDNIK